MQRLGLLVFMILVLSAGPIQAQKAAGGPYGDGVGAHGSHGGGPGPRNGFFPGHSGIHRHPGYGTLWLPWDGQYWDGDGYLPDEPSYQQSTNTTPPQVIVVEARLPAPPPEPPKLIEMPQSKEVPVGKQQRPTLFVLKDGERVESRYYLLTVESLTIEVDRQQRTIPASTLDLDATSAANHERGIEVVIPRDRSTVFFGF
jgi:hypothetical protein